MVGSHDPTVVNRQESHILRVWHWYGPATLICRDRTFTQGVCMEKNQQGVVAIASPSGDGDPIDPRKLARMNRGPIAKIWDQVLALWEFVKDPDAPLAGKAIAVGALIYLISPIDAVPDFIPFAGLLDDVSVIAAAVAKLANDLKKYSRDDEPPMLLSPVTIGPKPGPPSSGEEKKLPAEQAPAVDGFYGLPLKGPLI